MAATHICFHLVFAGMQRSRLFYHLYAEVTLFTEIRDGDSQVKAFYKRTLQSWLYQVLFRSQQRRETKKVYPSLVQTKPTVMLTNIRKM